jgi:hypothetical protein
MSKSNIDTIKSSLFGELKSLLPLIHQLIERIDTSLPFYPDSPTLFNEVRDFCIYLSRMYHGSTICIDTDFIDKSYTISDNICIIRNRIHNIIYDIDMYQISK